MRKYAKKFVTEDEGIETIEFVALLAVAAVLITIVAAIGSKMAAKGNEVESSIGSALDSVGNS